MSPLGAVLFDMDGLLVNTEEFWFQAECAVASELGAPWGRVQQAALVGGPLSSVGDLLRERSGTTRTSAVIVERLIDVMHDLLLAHEVALMPGAADLLAALAAEGVPCALVSASPRRLVDAVLDSLRARGLAPFATTVAGDEVVRTKPHPEPYVTAAARLQVPPRQCVVLEDSPTGVASAEAAGCFVVAVPSLRAIVPTGRRLVVRWLGDLDVPALRRLVTGAA